MGIVFAILIFEIIIVIHELGHFIAAKSNGVKVNEFAIGMGPAIFKKKKGETLYALRIFPIGGYCAMEGEDDSSDDSRALCKKPVWRRIIIVVAGVVMNLVLGLVILIISTATGGDITSRTVSKFEENASSQASGLQAGDKIVRVNGMHIFTAMDMSYQFQNDKDGVYDMTVVRDGKKVDLKDISLAADDGKTHIDFFVYPQKRTFGSVISESSRMLVTDARLIYISLIDMVRGKYSIRDLSGPVGIVDSIDTVIDNQTDKSTGKIDWASLVQTLMSLSAFITINLGIFNLLPLPALDGGRLIFLIIEGIRRKPVKPEHEGLVHAIGFAALIVLMLVITVSDVMKMI